MPVTKTTRRGNGEGWGGAANGEGKKGAGHGQGRPEGVKNGEGKKARALAALEDAAPAAAAMVVQIASDPNDQRALAAAQHILLRVLGDPAKRLEVSGPDGAALRIERVIIDPSANPDA